MHPRLPCPSYASASRPITSATQSDSACGRAKPARAVARRHQICLFLDNARYDQLSALRQRIRQRILP